MYQPLEPTLATPIIPWIGGKRRLADIIIPRFPAHTCYVEVFAGGAALYFMRPPAQVEVINDINGELVNLYRVVQRHLEEFVRQFKWALSSREVAAAFWVPVSALREQTAWGTGSVSVGGTQREVAIFQHGEYTVWGLTERVLRQFLAYIGEPPTGR